MSLTADSILTSPPVPQPVAPPPTGRGTIDSHVSLVRRRKLTTLFLRATGLASVTIASGEVARVLADKLFQYSVPHHWYVLGAECLVGLACAATYAYLRRPTPLSAAIEIDRALDTRERLSTALLLRKSADHRNDPFASAALQDAQRFAAYLRPAKHFPVRWPRSLATALAIAAVAYLAHLYVPQQDLFHHGADKLAVAAQEQKAAEARKQVDKALKVINEKIPVVAGDTSVERAKKDLETLLARPIADPAAAQRSALSALQDLEKAVQQKVQANQKYAAAEADRRNLSRLQPGPDDKGPVAEATRAISNGDFDQAVKKLDKAVKEFENLSADEQKQQAQQMKSLAAQLQQMAADPSKQQQMQQNLQKMLQQQGVQQQQAQQLAQQMAQQMQQAATGNAAQQQQAQQNLQKMAQQAIQQANNGQGLSQMQQNALTQALRQQMGQAQSQAQAQQLGQAAQALAQAMQNASQPQGQQGQQQSGQNPQQGQQAQSGQQGNQQGQNSKQGQQQAQGGQQQGNQQQQGGQQQSGQQGGQQGSQQANGQQGSQQGSQQGNQQSAQGNQQSSQGGQQGNQQGGQQGMQSALNDMKQQLDSMKDMQNDAQSLDAAGQEAGDAAQAQAGQMGNNGQGDGQGQGNGDGPNGEWGNKNPKGQGEGQGRQGGQATGDRNYKQATPYGVKKERAPVQNIDGGKILASSLVKAGTVKGDAKEQLKAVQKAAEQEAAEEVDTDRVSRSAQKAVKEYFNSLGDQNAKPADQK
jgi:hypothetical protein